MSDELEAVDVDGRRWYKIAEDNAFFDILEGFAKYRDAYKEYMTTFGVAVQAGGYCGVFPRLLGEMFDTVYTFEPDPSNFFCLNLNCSRDNIIKAQGALGNEHGLISVVRQNAANRGMNNVQHTINSKIPTYIIDELDLQACDLLQLDTEGYEHKILQGAKNTIDRFRPLISVEDSTPQISEFLDTFGYKEVTKVYRDTVFKCER